MEEQTTIKATRAARRVWLKRLAQNTFSKPEQHWRPKLEAELYDIDYIKVTIRLLSITKRWCCNFQQADEANVSVSEPHPFLQTQGICINRLYLLSCS